MDFGVFDSLIDAVAVVDGERRIIYCNEALAALAGSSVRRLTRGVCFSDVLEFSDKDLYPMPSGEKGKDGPAPLSEIDFSAKVSGKAGKLQVAVQPFSEGAGDPRWVVVMHDVTLEETLHTKYQGELEQKEGYIRELQEAKSKLEQYSKNLEQMVEERTAEVRVANRMLNAIMNSLGQGFIVFDQTGICSKVFTKACEEVLEAIPVGKNVSDLLSLQGAERQQFEMWIKAAFAEALPFESMVELAPSQFHHSQGRHVTLSYYPIRSDGGEITNLVLVATDRTREYEAEQALAKEQQFIRMVVRVVKNRDQFSQFLTSVRQMINQLKRLAAQGHEKFDFPEAFRVLHTIEGESGLFSAQLIRQASRVCQEVIEPIKFGEQADRAEVFMALLAKLDDLEGALDTFISDNREILDALRVGGSKNVEIPADKLIGFADTLEQHHCSTAVRKLFDEELLKQSLTNSVRHFNEVSQHVAQVQGKMLRNLEFDCDRVKIRPGAFSVLISALVHAFRNAVDHGIESPEVRMERGKAEAGSIRVSAHYFDEQNRRWIRLCIEDDGGGIDAKIIREKLLRNDPGGPYAGLSDNEVVQYVFMPGFSSRESVGAFSGRGIGMDAIKTEVDRLGGRVRVDTTLGKGTKLTLEFPDQVVDDSMDMAA